MPKPRYVRAVDPERRQKWLDVLGTDTLPIKSTEVEMTDNLFGPSDEPVPAYILDLGRLTHVQQHNLFANCARETGYSIRVVAVALLFFSGVGLPIEGLELVEDPDGQ